jgi:hypothetical protein
MLSKALLELRLRLGLARKTLAEKLTVSHGLPAGLADTQYEAIGIDHGLAAQLEIRLTERRTFKRSAYAPRRAFTKEYLQDLAQQRALRTCSSVQKNRSHPPRYGWRVGVHFEGGEPYMILPSPKGGSL